MRFNLCNTIFPLAAIALTSIAPSLAISITDINTDDLNTIINQGLVQAGVWGVLESYGETQLIPFPSHDGKAVVAIKNGTVQWFDKILTLTPDDLTEDFSQLVFFVTNNTTYHWSDYHFEFYDPSFTEKIPLFAIAAWETTGFDTGDAIFDGIVQETSMTGNVPDDSLTVADGFNFYGLPGVPPGETWGSLIAFINDATIAFGICTEGVECQIGIRQIATASTPEPSSVLGLLALGILKRKQKLS